MQPAAEGAEEILDNLDLGEPVIIGRILLSLRSGKGHARVCHLHAQKMAEKMVEEKMREELIMQEQL